MNRADLDIPVTARPAPGRSGRYWQFVKVTTACGIAGRGVVCVAAIGPRWRRWRRACGAFLHSGAARAARGAVGAGRQIHPDQAR